VIVNGSFNTVEELEIYDTYFSSLLIGRNDVQTESNKVRFNHIDRSRHGTGILLLRRNTHSTLLNDNVVEYNMSHDNGYMPNGLKVPVIPGDPAGGGNSDGVGAAKDCHDRTVYSVGSVNLLNLCPRNTVRGNLVWHNADDGYDFSFGDGSRVIGNIGWENGPEGNKGIKLLRSVLGGIQIYGNVLFGQIRGIEPRFYSTGQVVNNTTFGNDSQGIIATSENPSSAVVIANNVSFGNGSTDIIGDEKFSYKTNWASDVDGMPDVSNPGFTEADIVTDCSTAPDTLNTVRDCVQYITNQVKSALRPSSGSALIDAGTVVAGLHCARSDNDPQNPMPADSDCQHWNGSAPDLGAFEFGKARPSAPTLIDSNK
jgi:hypothetical protein